eukprot:15437334-Alexandrium_andersonii.AAC.1
MHACVTVCVLAGLGGEGVTAPVYLLTYCRDASPPSLTYLLTYLPLGCVTALGYLLTSLSRGSAAAPRACVHARTCKGVVLTVCWEGTGGPYRKDSFVDSALTTF